MTLEIIVFIGAILLGILMYWRESRNNALYRFFNKLLNTKKLQMKASDRKGFLFQQNFIFRLVYMTLLCGLVYGGVSALTPLNIFSFELFTASVVGMLGGSYLASAILFANSKIEDNKDIVEETISKGKDFIDDIVDNKPEESSREAPKTEETPKEEKKSARERLKDKGLLK
ncbi:hypothetical protein [Aquimarina sp. MMG016]|uniref:hypothetical protein n=1 Tax=Aquimarina sp. MMG016 TaxID=2822690 RepID=UPI001B3A5687|nr:hypothetical protein [Aquimarina sp. MMG016]MBQ4820111.1 hypothetical protein [Aquimarina sp. MMG016]